MISGGGFTELMLASQRGHLEIVQMLLENGARVDMVTEMGHSALILAAINNHPRVVKMLLDWGSQKNLKDYHSRMAIDYAKNPEIIDMLS